MRKYLQRYGVWWLGGLQHPLKFKTKFFVYIFFFTLYKVPSIRMRLSKKKKKNINLWLATIPDTPVWVENNYALSTTVDNF